MWTWLCKSPKRAGTITLVAVRRTDLRECLKYSTEGWHEERGRDSVSIGEVNIVSGKEGRSREDSIPYPYCRCSR